MPNESRVHSQTYSISNKTQTLIFHVNRSYSTFGNFRVSVNCTEGVHVYSSTTVCTVEERITGLSIRPVVDVSFESEITVSWFIETGTNVHYNVTLNRTQLSDVRHLDHGSTTTITKLRYQTTGTFVVMVTAENLVTKPPPVAFVAFKVTRLSIKGTSCMEL